MLRLGIFREPKNKAPFYVRRNTRKYQTRGFQPKTKDQISLRLCGLVFGLSGLPLLYSLTSSTTLADEGKLKSKQKTDEAALYNFIVNQSNNCSRMLQIFYNHFGEINNELSIEMIENALENHERYEIDSYRLMVARLELENELTIAKACSSVFYNSRNRLFVYSICYLFGSFISLIRKIRNDFRLPEAIQALANFGFYSISYLGLFFFTNSALRYFLKNPELPTKPKSFKESYKSIKSPRDATIVIAEYFLNLSPPNKQQELKKFTRRFVSEELQLIETVKTSDIQLPAAYREHRKKLLQLAMMVDRIKFFASKTKPIEEAKFLIDDIHEFTALLYETNDLKRLKNPEIPFNQAELQNIDPDELVDDDRDLARQLLKGILFGAFGWFFPSTDMRFSAVLFGVLSSLLVSSENYSFDRAEYFLNVAKMREDEYQYWRLVVENSKKISSK